MRNKSVRVSETRLMLRHRGQEELDLQERRTRKPRKTSIAGVKAHVKQAKTGTAEKC
jgi:hypothetical protein